MTTEDLIAYYQNVLIIQYKTMPNAVATIGLLSSQVVANLIYSQVLDGFSLDSAVGAQLDILAAYVGLTRAVAGFSPSVTFLQLPFYADGGSGFGGFGSYTNLSAPSDFWKSYTTMTDSYVLSDGQLRALIQYLVTIRNSNFSNQVIDQVMERFFGQYVTLTDGEDMTLTYTHSASTDPSQLFAIVNYLGLLPSPAGVTITVVET